MQTDLPVSSSSSASNWVVDKGTFNPKKVIRFPSLKRGKEEIPLGDRVKLERVLGLTVTSNACLDCDPSSGIVAYPAGCVVVLYNPRKNKQTHILNASKKTITTLSISPDGRYLATGECGHQPHVRVWDIQERIQVAEFPGHKFGINCVAFSPNLKYVVSVGSQHDMIVNVWDWRNNSKVASNKVSSKVKAVAFSEDGGHFVTVGNRHVKFWYLEYFRSSKYKEPVPLMGRSAILGEQRNNYFCDVACGQGDMADSTFAITKSGLLCEFNNRRLLDKWVELRTTSANCITVGIDYIFIGCANGIVRCFSPYTLEFITTLPRTHYLGIDVSKGLTISHMGSYPTSAKYPDTVAITLDENNHKVTCIYSDHSMYIWDIRDIRKVGKSHSFLFHSACIWGIEMYPVLDERINPVLPPGSFITCSSDDTIRVWNLDNNFNQETAYKRNIYSSDLLKVLYVDEGLTYLCDVDHNTGVSSEKVDSTYDGRNGVRCIRISPDGRQLASGDRSGNIRIHEIQFMDELCKIEAHDAEVLCLEYSKPDTGHRFLASASRDRLIHVFDVDKGYAFQQTLDDHSSSITAVRFVQVNGQLQMISCGADKSVIFRSAQYSPQLHFSRDHHVVGKTTLYDMEVDVTQKHILTACQDRNIRVYSVNTGKHSRTFKGSVNEDGTLIKVILDNSGLFVATSSTDKNLCIYDFYSGECMATMFGHSELVTGFRFTNDGKHLISVSGDGCIFVWKLPAELTHAMQIRLSQMSHTAKVKAESRRSVFAVPRPLKPAEEIDNEFVPGNPEMFDPNANEMDSTGLYRFSVGPLPLWAKKQIAEDTAQVGSVGKVPNLPQAKGRWAQRIDSQGIVVKSIYDSGHVIPFPVQPENRRFTAEPESFADSEIHKFTDVKKEIVTISRETPLSSISSRRGTSTLELRVRHPTDSSMSSVPIDDGEFDGDVADDETDSTEAEGQEIIYYPPSEDSFHVADEEYKVCNTNPDDLREAHRKNRKNKAERPTDIPLVHIQGVRSTDSEDEEEATTPHGTDRSVLNMFSISTESLDRVGEREKFLKNNFESLDGDKSSDNENHDNRLSITAKYLSRSHPRNSAKSKKEQEALSPRKLELMKQMEENRKKLDKITWKASLNSSKSISDLTHIPEKDLYGRSHLINKGIEILKSDNVITSSMPDLSDTINHTSSSVTNSGKTSPEPSTRPRTNSLPRSIPRKRKAFSASVTGTPRTFSSLPRRGSPQLIHPTNQFNYGYNRGGVGISGGGYSNNISDSSTKTNSNNASAGQISRGIPSPKASVKSGSSSVGGGVGQKQNFKLTKQILAKKVTIQEVLPSKCDSENSSSDTIRRAASMTDLSKPRRLLPFPPSHVASAKSSVKSDSSGLGSSRPSSGNSSDFARLSRSSSLSTLAGGDDDSSRIMRPTISSSNKVRGSQEHLSRRALPKSASSTSIAGSRRGGASDTSSGETSPTENKSTFSLRARSTSMDRNSSRPPYHSDQKTIGSLRSSAIPRSSFGSSRSTSERDLSRVGRDSTNRLSLASGTSSGNITVTKTSKHEMLVKRSTFTTRKSIMVTSDKVITNDHSCKMLEKSPEELPVKDTRQERDVTNALLNRKLCEVTADDLKLASDNLLQLYKRISMETDLPESERLDMLNVLSEGVSESQQTLRPVNPTPGFYPDPAQIAALAASRKNSDVTSSSDPMSLLQQYSDMLVTLVQQRMTTQTGSS